jgi:hypothetical protein
MGRAVAALIDRELAAALGALGGNDGPLFAPQAEERLANWEARLSSREFDLDAAEQRIRRWSERLRSRERVLEVRERSIEAMAKLSTMSAIAQIEAGRNERCPWGQASSTSTATACRVGRRNRVLEGPMEGRRRSARNHRRTLGLALLRRPADDSCHPGQARFRQGS